MAIFRPKPWVNLFGKFQFFAFLNFLFLQLRKAFFRSRISLRRFCWSILPLKKGGKLATFGPKPWINPFGKMSIFLNFLTSCFSSLQRHFFVLENRKEHFPGLYDHKKKVGKMAIFGPKPWVNPSGEMTIFPLFKHLVFIAQNSVFLFQNIVKNIFLAYIA